MENRYLYKAKTTPKEKGEFNNVWVIGNLILSNGKYYIHPVDNIVKIRNEIGRIIVMHEVIPDTICQCTGLKDKNEMIKRQEYSEAIKDDIKKESAEGHGIYETIRKTLENEKNLKIKIEQTKGTLNGNLVKIKNTKTGETYDTVLEDGNIFGAKVFAETAIKKLNSGVYKNNKKILKKIERTLNIKFEKWQKDYILSKKSEYPLQGRRTGKTLAHQVKTLITTTQKNIVINGNNMTAWSDEKHIGRTYEKIYAMQLAELSEKLRTEGLDIPKVILKSNE